MMAWHVSNNAGNSNVNIFDENFGESLDMCMIYTIFMIYTRKTTMVFAWPCIATSSSPPLSAT